jgi:hypothetical protein
VISTAAIRFFELKLDFVKRIDADDIDGRGYGIPENKNNYRYPQLE